ncbi:fosmidomycin resistance protein [Hallella multisaccharivorax DSM 17128]|uniref:Major facilitator superfamily MFS_1 n=1 Tax=Hallella multisaccharivorax DSM 17128 TaxID=688246 RepID=F8N9E3_9BACT|nr:MFS transporter [Hallella multisaccharivorax]EGN57752.1 major facilitator superfamily MFS_1 [Hallella multisaccharivorax DSM 17128]GJG30987.1 fosmidomycin resistance protein [Hallella multisaccharivorax DSM 17128]
MDNVPTSTATPIDTERTVYGVLFSVCLCHLLNDSIQSILPAIYPMLKETFALSFIQVGIITLVFQITSSLIQPWVGRYADHHRHSWQLSVAMLFSLVGVVLISFASRYATLLIAVALIGCGSSIFHPQAAQIAQVASGGRKDLAQSIFQVGGNGGYAIGPIIAALVILPHGIRAFLWISVITLVLAVLLFFIGRWHTRQAGISHKKTRARWTTVRSYSRRHIYFFIFVLFVLMFSKNFYSASMTNYFSFFLIDKFGISQRGAQFCLFAYLAAQVLGTILGGVVGDKYGRKGIIWFSILGVSPFTLALPYVSTLFGAIVLSIIIGLIMSSAFTAIMVFASDLMPDSTGSIAGIFYGLSFGFAGIGSSFFGWLADSTNMQTVFEVSTLLPLMGILAIFLPKMKKE